jgi:hypothetical protein
MLTDLRIRPPPPALIKIEVAARSLFSFAVGG